MHIEDNDSMLAIHLGVTVGALVFLVSWVHCFIEYGYLLGLGLGWLPSAIVGGVLGYLCGAIVAFIES